MLNNIHSHFIAPFTITSIDCVTYDSTQILPDIFSVGIHPWSISSIESTKQLILQRFSELAAHPNCVAIGECGLDKLKGGNFNLQVELFQFQLELAEKLNKPIIIHCVKAYDELINIRKVNSSTTWIIHGFRGKKELALQLEHHRIRLSFGVHLLSSEQVQTAYLALANNTVFFETDTDVPELIHEVISFAAQLKNVSLDSFYENYTILCKETFNIN